MATCVQNKAVDSIAKKLGSLFVGDDTATSSDPYSSSVSDELSPLFAKVTIIMLDEAGLVSESTLPLLLTLNPTGGIPAL